MFWKRDHRVIKVEMIDAQTGATLKRGELAIERLPASFESDTTMHIGERNYSVVEAVPMTAEEFRRTGKLRLVVREVKVEKIDPGTLLFSLPTISNEFPPGMIPGSSNFGKNAIEIHEDDWRQIEFVSISLAEQIGAEIQDIRRIWAEELVPQSGFRQVHVRRRVPSPLPAGLAQVAELKLANATVLDGFALRGVAGLVMNGFAIRLISGLELFGTATNDAGITALCLSAAGPNNALEQDLPVLARFASAHELCLVDWCRCAQTPPDEAALRAYFQRDGQG